MKNTASLATRMALLAVFSMLLLVSFQRSEAQAGKVLYSFCPTNCYDGEWPDGSLTPDGYGGFYGMTWSGGTPACDGVSGCVGGTVFQLIPEPTGGCPSGSTPGNGWCEYVIYNFCSAAGSTWPDCPDGEQPVGSLLLVRTGTPENPIINLYGTTNNGGYSGNCNVPEGCGTVFELSPASPPLGCPSGTTPGNNGWCQKVIYKFCSQASCTDGYLPAGGLVRDSAGNLYGTASNGVFELSPISGGAWFETILYWVVTAGGVAMDTAENLYGADSNQNIFKLYRDSSGRWNAINIHTFGSPTDGMYPYGTPAVDSAGNVYGTTTYGGSANYGTVWKLIPLGLGAYEEKRLHSFTGETTGWYPESGVILDASGNIYGTTNTGGKYTQCQTGSVTVSCGTVFKLGRSGSTYQYKLLWSFNGTDGATPYAPPILDTSGKLYGTTYWGGASNVGAVFEVNPAWITTGTKLTSSLNPSIHGETVTFTATVRSTNGAPPDGETVKFMKGSTLLGTGTLSHGSATFPTSTLPVGTSYIHAVYGGDSNFGSSTSNTVSQIVNQ